MSAASDLLDLPAEGTAIVRELGVKRILYLVVLVPILVNVAVVTLGGLPYIGAAMLDGMLPTTPTVPGLAITASFTPFENLAEILWAAALLAGCVGSTVQRAHRSSGPWWGSPGKFFRMAAPFLPPTAAFRLVFHEEWGAFNGFFRIAPRGELGWTRTALAAAFLLAWSWLFALAPVALAENRCVLEALREARERARGHGPLCLATTLLPLALVAGSIFSFVAVIVVSENGSMAVPELAPAPAGLAVAASLLAAPLLSGVLKVAAWRIVERAREASP